MRVSWFFLASTLLSVSACSGSEAAGGTGTSGAGGAATGGTGGAGGQSADTTGAGGSFGTSGGAGGGGGSASVNCADLTECGNLGLGCINCAINSTCALPYDTCFKDDQCAKYATCVDGCVMKGPDCIQACVQSFPMGAMNFQALAQCVFCQVCTTSCMPPPGGCMP